MPPTMNGMARRASKPRRTVSMASSWPTTEPNTTMGAASCGSIDQAQMLIATRPNAKPDRPCTKPARHVPSTTDTRTSLVMGRSVGGPAAVDQHALASHVSRCIGGEEHCRAHHVICACEAAHRCVVEQAFAMHVMLEQRMRKVGVHPPGCQRVHPDAALCPIERQRTGEHFDAALGSAIRH